MLKIFGEFAAKEKTQREVVTKGKFANVTGLLPSTFRFYQEL